MHLLPARSYRLAQSICRCRSLWNACSPGPVTGLHSGVFLLARLESPEHLTRRFLLALEGADYSHCSELSCRRGFIEFISLAAMGTLQRAAHDLLSTSTGTFAILEAPIQDVLAGELDPQHVCPIGSRPDLDVPDQGAGQIVHLDRLADENGLAGFARLEHRETLIMD